jgi:hypothetical protein
LAGMWKRYFICFCCYNDYCLSKHIFRRNLGTTSRSCTNFSYAQLGNGVQKMVSFVQNLNLLWKSKRSTAKTNG